jgi:AdoMet-dependent heme synthase
MTSKPATNKIKPFYRPPSLLFKQLGSALLMGYLNGWRQLFPWLLRDGFKSLPVSNGALGMGCIGYPGHPVWEVTTACNLTCIHCHAVSGKPDPNELSTDEGKRLIDQIAEVSGFRTLVYTGGEPLVRPDIFDLLKHSKEVGFANIIATNGTLINEDMAWKLKEYGVVCNAISIDASDPDIHNHVRNSPKAFDLALRAIEATKKAGILLQINTTAMEYNMENLSDLIDFVDKHNASIMLMYQLVAVGRGEKIEKATLKKSANENLSHLISQKQKHSRTLIEPVAGPQYWPYLLEKKGCENGLMLKFAEKVFHGCAAGRGFVYVKSNGDVWPCPFVEVNAGNVRQKTFREIYEESTVFKNLRNRENMLKGLCGNCHYRTICGGCRGRAHAYSGDYLAEDPRCFIRK